MIRTREELRGLVFEASSSAWTLAALGFAMESGLFELLAQPKTLEELVAMSPRLPPSRIAAVLDVLAVAGLCVRDGERWALSEGAGLAAGGALTGEVRSALMQANALLDSANGATAGWKHTDPALLRAQGAASSAFAPMFKAQMVPQMGDLGERLAGPGARFLDVGVGVAALTIAMCRAWPALSAVGLDPFEAPLAIARDAVAQANMKDRIELRQMGVEALTDEGVFDLAWLPAVFVPEPSLAKAVERVTASLRDGGWVIAAVVSEAGDERGKATWRLINELWGGARRTAKDIEGFLVGAGLSEVRSVSGPPWAPCIVMGRRSRRE